MKSIVRLLREHDKDFCNTPISQGTKLVNTGRSGALKQVGMPGHISDFLSQDNETVVDLNPDVITSPTWNWERHRNFRRRNRDNIIDAIPVEQPNKKEIVDVR